MQNTIDLHYNFRPSNLERYQLCPGAARMEAGIPEGEKPKETSAGTLLHGLVEKYIQDEGFEIPLLADEDRGALEFAMGVYDELFPPMNPFVITPEVRLDLSPIHSEIPGGTADVVAWDEEEKHLLVLDWKFTYIDPPWAPANIQLATYCAGAAHRYGAVSVTGYLVCARSQRVSTVEYSNGGLTNIVGAVRQIIGAGRSPWAPCIPGASQCRYCKAKTVCPALLEQANLPTLKDPGDISNAELGRICALIDDAEPIIKAYKKQRDRILAAGGDVPGWAWKPGRGRRIWADGVTVEKLETVGKELDKPTGSLVEVKKTVVSPSKLEKQWGKAKNVREAMADLVSEKPGRPKALRVKEE